LKKARPFSSLVILMRVNVPVAYMAQYVMVLSVQHHYEGHWMGWALKIETFLGPEMATSEASAIWAQKIQIQPSVQNNLEINSAVISA
jgi:hypothetical protein